MSQGKNLNEGTSSKYLLDNNKLLDLTNSQKSKFNLSLVSNYRIIKNPDLQKKSESNMNRNNPNQKSISNLKPSSNLDNFKLPSTRQGNNSVNTIRTSSNFNKPIIYPASSNYNNKNSDNFSIVKNNSKNNNNTMSLLNNNPSNGIFERASFSQIGNEQISKNGSSRPLELVSPETERYTKSKYNQFSRKILIIEEKTKKNNNFFSSVEDNKKSEFPTVHHKNSIQEEYIKI